MTALPATFLEMSDKQLIQIATDCYNAIETDCFGIKDLCNLDGARQELFKRGYTFEELPRRCRIRRNLIIV